jgi:hypothetical protein
MKGYRSVSLQSGRAISLNRPTLHHTVGEGGTLLGPRKFELLLFYRKTDCHFPHIHPYPSRTTLVPFLKKENHTFDELFWGYPEKLNTLEKE